MLDCGEQVYVDEIYDDRLFNHPRRSRGKGCGKISDLGVIDGISTAGRLVTRFGGVIRYLQIGFVGAVAGLIILAAP